MYLITAVIFKVILLVESLMKIIIFFLFLAVTGNCFSGNANPATVTKEAKQPNILLIVADDLGFSDLGSLGGEIDTHNLDSIAASGITLTNFYAAPLCSPTRAMMLSGTDNHLAGLGTMGEISRSVAPVRQGYEGYLNQRVVSVASLLQDAGYHTYMTGKWHLGTGKTQGPDSRGFERSFMLANGGASHFGDARPMIPNVPSIYREDGADVSLPKYFYSSNFYTDKLIEYIEKDRKDSRPFFAYAAFTAPHAPLHVPDDYLDTYRGKYDAGYDVLREIRLQRSIELGLLPVGTTSSPRRRDVPAWDSLDQQEKKDSARQMEIYASMIDNLDDNVGRLLVYLDKIGERENTVIVFISDNGADGFGDFFKKINMKKWLEEKYDNSLDNAGRPNSSLILGAAWAQASSVPHRDFKGYTTEGGIHVPAFITGLDSDKNSSRDANLSSVMDIAPTLLDLAGISHPGTTYQGREVLPYHGKSLLPYLTGQSAKLHATAHYLGWELLGNRAIRQGDWKLVLTPAPFGNNQWQLFNLAKDPAESVNLSVTEPKQMAHMLSLWEQYVKDNGVDLQPRTFFNKKKQLQPETKSGQIKPKRLP